MRLGCYALSLKLGNRSNALRLMVSHETYKTSIVPEGDKLCPMPAGVYVFSACNYTQLPPRGSILILVFFRKPTPLARQKLHYTYVFGEFDDDFLFAYSI